MPGVRSVVLQKYFKRSFPAASVFVEVVVTLAEVKLRVFVVFLRPESGGGVLVSVVLPRSPHVCPVPHTL